MLTSVSSFRTRLLQQQTIRFQGTEETPPAKEPVEAPPASEAEAPQAEVQSPPPKAESKPGWWRKTRFYVSNRRHGLGNQSQRIAHYLSTQADGYQKKGKTDKALAAIETYLKLEPPTAETYRELSALFGQWVDRKVKFKEMDFQAKSLEMANKALELEPDAYSSYARLAEQQAEQPEAAIAALESGREKVKAEEKPILLQALGTLYLEQGNLDKGLELFKQTSQLLSDDADALVDLSRRLQQWDLKPIQEFAGTLLEQVKLVKPGHTTARGELGKLYMRRGQIKEAMLEFFMAYELAQRKGKLPFGKAESTDILEAAARGYLKASQPDKAAQVFEDIVQLAPNDLKPRWQLAQIYTDLDQTVGTSKMPAAYTPVIEADPNFFMGRAIAHYNKIGENDKPNPEPHRRLAELFKRMAMLTDGNFTRPPRPFLEQFKDQTAKKGSTGYTTLQINALQEACHRFDLSPQRSEAEIEQDCQTRCAIGGVYEQMNNLQGAILNYNQIIKRYPKSQAPVKALGELQKRMRQPLAIIKTYTDASERNALASWPWLLLGELHESQNRPVDSRLAYERAARNSESELSKSPLKRELYVQLEQIYTKLNQPEKAKNVMGRMKAAMPDSQPKNTEN